MPAHRVPVDVRFWPKVAKSSDCWLWIGAMSQTGYGAFWISTERGMTAAHRMSWEMKHGPIPEGAEVDHLCFVKACVRPDHLDAVTHDENMKRADVRYRLRSAATHCSRGHEYDEANTYRHSGRRHCRACRAEQSRQAKDTR